MGKENGMSAYHNNTRARARTAAVLACATLALVAGCRRLEMDVTVDREGGGERRLTMTVEERDASPGAPTETQARELLGVTEARGWRAGVAEKTGDDGRTRSLTTYTRTWRAGSLRDWSAASGDICMKAAPAGAPRASVQLANRVEVETGRGTGVDTWTYRETFAWSGLLEALVAVAADGYRDAVASAYPFLDATELAELRGLARGAFTVGMRAGGGGKDGDEMDEEMVIAALADESATIVARARPGAATGRLQEIATAVVKDQDDAIGDFMDRELPGVALAGETAIVLTVRLPGRIVETNGQVADDGSVRWEFGGGDPLGRPQVCWARSEVAK